MPVRAGGPGRAPFPSLGRYWHIIKPIPPSWCSASQPAVPGWGPFPSLGWYCHIIKPIPPSRCSASQPAVPGPPTRTGTTAQYLGGFSGPARCAGPARPPCRYGRAASYAATWAMTSQTALHISSRYSGRQYSIQIHCITPSYNTMPCIADIAMYG